LTRDHDGIELVPKFKEQVTDITIFTPAEVTQFLTHAREEMIPFLAIGAFAGLRSAEIERLEWQEVNLENRFIEVKAAKAKTAARRIVPISDNLAAWLKDRTKDAGRVVPFDSVNKQIGWLEEDVDMVLALDALQKAAAKAGRGDWTDEVLKNAHLKWLKAARSADAEKKRAKAGKAKAVRAKAELPQARLGHTFLPDQTPVQYVPCPWRKNALRHSYISYRVADVQDVPKVALESGNSPQMIFQHYRELVQAKAAKEWFAIFPKREAAKSEEPKLDGQA
jgi:integrase